VASLKNQYLRKIIREIIDFIRLFTRIIAAYSQGSTEMTARFSPVSPLISNQSSHTGPQIRPIFEPGERTSASANDDGGTRVFLAVLEDDQVSATGRWGRG
jgi:hypothetical protein